MHAEWICREAEDRPEDLEWLLEHWSARSDIDNAIFVDILVRANLLSEDVDTQN